MTETDQERKFEPAGSWRTRGLALGGILLFAVVFVIARQLLEIATWRALAGLHAPTAQATFGAAETAACALLATLLLAPIGRKPFGRFGWRGTGRLRNFGVGAAGGLLLVSLLVLVSSLIGAVSFGPISTTGLGALQHGLWYAVMFLFVALGEESVFRGYPLVALSETFSFWPAAIVLAALFGAVHLHNSQESLAGAAFAAGYALVAVYSFRRTGSLWFAFGLHAGWDFAESFIFGVPDSGIVLPGALLNPDFHGPVWLTGGSAGPEGSVLMLPVLFAMVWIVRKALTRTVAAACTPTANEAGGSAD